MANSRTHADLFATIPCLEDYACKIAEYMGDRGPVTSAVALRDRFIHFAMWAEEEEVRRYKQGIEREGGREILEMPITPADLVEYAKALEGRGMALSTISSYVSAIGTMHTAAGLFSPTADIKVRTYLAELRRLHVNDDLRQARSLSATELGNVLDSLYTPRITRGRKTETAEAAHKRANMDKALLLTMVQAGMRRNEAARLVWGEVKQEADGSGRVLLRTNWKRQSEVWVAISEPCLQALCAIKPDDADDASSVFRLSDSQIGRRLKRMCEEAGIDSTDVSGHTPRATLYRLMMEEEAPVAMLHQQLRLTQHPIEQKYLKSVEEGSSLGWLRKSVREKTVTYTA